MASPQSRTRFLIVVLTVLIVPWLYSDDSSGSERAWRVPSRWTGKENPVPNNDQAVTNGKRLYEQECLACHGVAGKGDGPSSRELEEEVVDLGAAEVSSQTDGALFFKITAGRKPMPGYRQLLSNDERWEVVHYLRTLMP